MRLDGFKLKLLAMILMVFDHLPKAIPHTPIWFGYLGRLVAPIFFYFVVEGFFHTRDRRKYLGRLSSWAAIMYGGSKLVMYLFPGEIPLHNNIFLSLALSVALMSVIEWAKDQKNTGNKGKFFLGILGAMIVSALSIFTEASIYGVAMTLVFYCFRDKKLYMAIGYIIISLGLTVGFTLNGLTYEQLFLYDYQWMMIFALPLILMYNGKRGLSTAFTKYMFYVFYPVHLWVIYIIGYCIAGK